MVDFYGVYVGKYISPMDPMGSFTHSLDIQIPPEEVFGWYVFRVQIPSQEVFGCLGIWKIRRYVNLDP